MCTSETSSSWSNKSNQTSCIWHWSLCVQSLLQRRCCYFKHCPVLLLVGLANFGFNSTLLVLDLHAKNCLDIAFFGFFFGQGVEFSTDWNIISSYLLPIPMPAKVVMVGFQFLQAKSDFIFLSYSYQCTRVTIF